MVTGLRHRPGRTVQAGSHRAHAASVAIMTGPRGSRSRRARSAGPSRRNGQGRLVEGDPQGVVAGREGPRRGEPRPSGRAWTPLGPPPFGSIAALRTIRAAPFGVSRPTTARPLAFDLQTHVGPARLVLDRRGRDSNQVDGFIDADGAPDGRGRGIRGGRGPIRRRSAVAPGPEEGGARRSPRPAGAGLVGARRSADVLRASLPSTVRVPDAGPGSSRPARRCRRRGGLALARRGEVPRSAP